MSVNVKTVLATNIKTRWREPFASEAINKRGLGVIPPGIYRGLLLEEKSPPVDLTVTVAIDPIASDHVAVIETTGGYSLNYANNSGAFDLALSDPSLLSQEVVVTLQVTYTVGVETTGKFIVYTVAEYNALSDAVRDGMAVLGSVVVPASGVIPAASISDTRRSFPFDRRSSSDIEWMPMIRNGSFDSGDTASHARGVLFWKRSESADYEWNYSTTDVSSEDQSLSYTVNTVSSPFTSNIEQRIGAEISYASGRRIRVAFKKRQLIAATSGDLLVRIRLKDLQGAGTMTTLITVPMTSTDASFVDVEAIYSLPTAVPARVVLDAVQLEMETAEFPGLGEAILIDNFQLWLEPDVTGLQPDGSVFGEMVDADAVNIRGVNSDSEWGGDHAELDFDGSRLTVKNPGGTGSIGVETDQVLLGPDILGSLAGAIVPRVKAPVSVFAGVEYTLMWESVPAGLAGYRKYVSASSGYAETVNAQWDNATNMWSKDVFGEKATRTWISLDSVDVEVQEKLVNTWADGAWTSKVSSLRSPEPTTLASPTFDPMHRVSDVEGNTRVLVDHNGFLTGGQSTIFRQNWDDFSKPAGWIESGAGSVSYFTDGIMGSPSALMNVGAGQESALYTPVMFRAHDDIIVTVEFEIHSPDPSGVIMLFGFFHIVNLQENGMYFYRDNATPEWAARTHFRSYPTVTETLTGITPVANVTQRFRMEWYGVNMPGGSRVLFYIDGALVAEHTTNITVAADRMPLFMDLADNGAGASRTMVVGPVVTYRNRRKSDDLL